MEEMEKVLREIEAIKQKKEETYADIGRIYAEKYADAVRDREIQGLLDDLEEADEEIAAKEERIRVLKGITSCGTCGREIKIGTLFCQYCGARQAPNQTAQQGSSDANRCPLCHTEVETGQLFCHNCGQKLVPSNPMTGLWEEETSAEETPATEPPAFDSYEETPAAETPTVDSYVQQSAAEEPVEEAPVQQPVNTWEPEKPAAEPQTFDSYEDKSEAESSVFDNDEEEPAANSFAQEQPVMENTQEEKTPSFDFSGDMDWMKPSWEAPQEPAASREKTPQPDFSAPQIRFCRECGQTLQPDDLFCPECGCRVRD